MKILKPVMILCSTISKAWFKFIAAPVIKSGFKCCGKNIKLCRHGHFSFNHISLGNNVSIGEYAYFMSSKAEIKIGSNVMFGPHNFIITGNHRADIVGRTMFSIGDNEKRPTDDKDVVICDDIWVGADCIILAGVTVGEGSIIAAGSVVTKDVEPYSIYAGCPA